MRFSAKLVFAVALTAGSAIGFVLDQHARDVEVLKAWGDLVPTAQSAVTGYMVIRNHGLRDDRIVAVSSTIADRVEFEYAAHPAEGIAPVRVDNVAIRGGSITVLWPGGRYLLISGLKHAVVAGDEIPVTLTFEKAGPLEVWLAVGQSQISSSAGLKADEKHRTAQFRSTP